MPVVGVDERAGVGVHGSEANLAVTRGLGECLSDPSGADLGRLRVPCAGDLDVAVAVPGQRGQRGRHHLSHSPLPVT